MTEAAAITVLVADDHAGFRSALESLLRSEPDLTLLGSAGTARRPSR
jgi:DNA-binding NarL/FixJ family response regulator